MFDRKQYNAAVKYLEKNSYRIARGDLIFTLVALCVIGYFTVLFVFKIISCF